MAEWLPTIGGGNFDLVTTNWGFESPRTVSGCKSVLQVPPLLTSRVFYEPTHLENLHRL